MGKTCDCWLGMGRFYSILKWKQYENIRVYILYVVAFCAKVHLLYLISKIYFEWEDITMASITINNTISSTPAGSFVTFWRSVLAESANAQTKTCSNLEPTTS